MNSPNNAVSDIYRYALEKVDFYRSGYPSVDSVVNFSDVPFLSRKQTLENVNMLLSDEYRSYPLSKTITVERSLGKTGEYLKTLWSADDYTASLGILDKYRKDWHRVGKGSKQLRFHTALYQGNMIVSNKQIVVEDGIMSIYCFAMNRENAPDISRQIMEFAPDCLVAPPSIAFQMARLFTCMNLPLPESLKYIELTGEESGEEAINLIQSTFHVRPVNLYSVKGLGGIAFECSSGSLHVLKENVFVEIVKDGKPVFGEEGEIVVTTLTNHAMPLIRYKTGDVGILSNAPCPCGCSSPVLEIKVGRKCALHLLEDGNFVSEYSLKSIIEHANENISCAIAQARFAWVSEGSISVILQLKPSYYGWDTAAIAEFLNNVPCTIFSLVFEFVFSSNYDHLT